MFLNPTANLLEPNADGTPYKIQPDPRTLEENPLYFIRNAELEDKRQRLMGSFGLRYSPLNWFDLEGNLSYDRSDRNSSDYYHKGFKTIDASTLNDGEYTKSNALDQAINASLTGSVNRTFGAFATSTSPIFRCGATAVRCLARRRGGTPISA